MDNAKILKKYHAKILGNYDYLGAKKKFLTVEDFSDIEKLKYFLYEMDCFESSLTEDGLKFLEEYYGLDKVIDIVLDEIKHGIDYKYCSRKDIEAWLKRLGMPELP